MRARTSDRRVPSFFFCHASEFIRLVLQLLRRETRAVVAREDGSGSCSEILWTTPLPLYGSFPGDNQPVRLAYQLPTTSKQPAVLFSQNKPAPANRTGSSAPSDLLRQSPCLISARKSFVDHGGAGAATALEQLGTAGWKWKGAASAVQH
jgi:hypothetical protein